MKLNKYEKVSFVFVSGFIAAVAVFIFNLAIHQGWFSAKNTYFVKVEQVEGVFPGTKVKMGGLKLGRVSDIQVQEDGSFHVYFEVFKKYDTKFTDNTEVGFLRPYIIGERILDVVANQGKKLPSGSQVKYTDNFDIIETFNGKKLGPYLGDLRSLFENISFLAKEFSNPQRSKDLVIIFDQLKPLLKNANQATIELNKMAVQMTRNNHLKTLVGNLATTTTAVNGSLDEIVAFTKQLPELGDNTTNVMYNLSELTYHLNALVPTIEAIAPDLPEASKSALNALQEALIVLQAMQKTFLLEGSVEEVREEMQERQRDIANEKEGNK